MSKIQVGEWSEEEYLFGHDKYSSNMYSNNQGNIPGSFNDKDMHHKHIRMMGTQKYLRENCYHCIECTVTTFLAEFMLRRPLNSVTLATTTHRKSKRMSDGTDIQVRAQIINKCMIKMAQMELYNIRGTSWGRNQKI